MKEVDIVSKIVNREGGTFVPSSKGTQPIDLSDYLLKSIWDKVWEIRTDSQGTEYIFGKLPVVTQYGITMYSGGNVDVPSLASGLPFDGRTIWYNPDTQQIEVIGGTGGGSGEGVSNFWDLSGIPSWITNSKPKYTYSEIEGTPDLTKYALASQIPSLSGYATESWVTKQNYATKATTLSGYGITDAYTKTNVDDLLMAYVTLSGSQTITGEKNFTGGLKVNGSPIYYDSTKKYWKLDGDLLVTGGVTMYGSDSSFTPSTIMDAIAVDGTTISKSGGVLKVIGGTGGGVADSVAWANITGKPTWIGSSKPSYSYSEITGAISTTELQNYLTSNSYLNVTSGDNRYLKLSGGTLTLPNHVGLVIKRTNVNSPVIAFYNNDELEHNYIGFEGNRPIIMNKVGVASTIWHSGNFTPSNYLPLSGGTITGELHVSSTSTNRAIIRLFSAADVPNDLLFGTNGEYHWSITSRNIEEGRYIGLYNNKEGSNGWVFKANYDTRVLDFMNTPTVNGNTIWHSDNDGSGSGLDADLLDGQHNGDLTAQYFSVGKILTSSDTINKLMSGVYCYINGNNPVGSVGDNAILLSFRNDGRTDMFQLANSANEHSLHYRSAANIGNSYENWSSWRTFAFTDSNVASATKLQTARTIWGQSFDGTGNVSGTVKTMSGHGLHIAVTDDTYWQSKGIISTSWESGLEDYTDILVPSSGANTAKIRLLKNGNVGIGTTNPAQKLHIVGRAKIESSDRYALEVSSTSSTGSHVLSFNGTGGNESAQIGFGENGLYAFNYAAYRNNSNNITAFGIDLNGIFYLGYSGNPSATNSRLTVDGSGNLLAKGGITMYSQKSLKNIQDERGLSLNELSVIKPTRYTWKDGRDNRLHFGGIADDIQQVLPEVVYKTSDGILTMDYGNAAFAIASSLIQPVVDHEKRIAMLEEENKQLRQEVERLKRA